MPITNGRQQTIIAKINQNQHRPTPFLDPINDHPGVIMVKPHQDNHTDIIHKELLENVLTVVLPDYDVGAVQSGMGRDY